jgi:DNA modification methylase
MKNNQYSDFLESKQLTAISVGIEPTEPHALLFDFQKDIVRWALRKGRAAIFADCGMGKTLMQLEWSRQIPGKVLILAPLAVAEQTVREGAKVGLDVVYSRTPVDAQITITNYQMLHNFNPADYTGVVLDESSIIKHFDGKLRNQIIDGFRNIPYRLACTATPAPNDFMELGNHSEFLGLLTRAEMLSTFFVHDGGDTSEWRLKRHAQADFWRWVCSWAVNLRKPSDLGYEDRDFVLPPVVFNECVVPQDGEPAITLMDRRKARSESTQARCEEAARLIATKPDEQWLIWCNLNIEAETVASLIPGAVNLTGSDKHEKKEAVMLGFSDGNVRVLVTKPSIAGFGLNWQNCHNVIFLGLSDSYEQLYQAVRRCWRFGQKEQVNVWTVTSSREGAVVENIKRKEADAATMAREMVANMHEINSKEVHGSIRQSEPYKEDVAQGDNFTMYLGDCVEKLAALPDESVHYSIFSPPFASLYTYSASERDMGNARNHSEFYEHFRYAIRELFRVLKPGRLLSFHVMNLPTSKSRDGVIGITDFRGELIKLFVEAGFIFHSEVTIWKNPVTAMQRTKALGLLHKQLKKDSCMSRQGIPDYLVTMRKPGDNPERVTHTNESFPVSVWQNYASPVWIDINPSNTLQRKSARAEKDERHICPLQLEVIARALRLWSNPGDVVLSPFAGIGSEGTESLQMGRKFIGIELKDSYYNQAVLNLHAAENGTLNVQGSPIEKMDKIIDMCVLDGHLEADKQALDLGASFSFLNSLPAEECYIP